MTENPKWLSDRRLEWTENILEGRRSSWSSRAIDDDSEHDGLLRDVAFNRHSMNDGEHVSPYDNGMTQVGADNIQVKLVQGIDEQQFRKTLSKATRATIGLPRDVDDRDAGDSEEMLKGGLQTALETAVIVFEVSGVSRTCTHQLVRSRRASFHQQSQRASYYGDHPEVRMPESVWRNRRARSAFLKAQMAAEAAYQIACDEDISYQDARYALLEGTTNYILCEYSIREFINVYAYRGCSMFSWEIVHVMREMRRLLIEAHPFLEPYVLISCQKTGPVMVDGPMIPAPGDDGVRVPAGSRKLAEHHCTFQGWESVEEQCSFPWALEEARTFKPSHHQIGKKESR